MTSRVISIWGLVMRVLARSRAKNGFSVPNASEWSSTETRDSRRLAAAGLVDRRDDLARACSSSAALTLKNSALRPAAADLGDDAVRVRLRATCGRGGRRRCSTRPARARASRPRRTRTRRRGRGPSGSAIGGQGGAILHGVAETDVRVDAPASDRRDARTRPRRLLRSRLAGAPARSRRLDRAARLLARGARRDALRRDPARDARDGRPRGAAAERRAVLREAAPPLLGQRRLASASSARRPGRRASRRGSPASGPRCSCVLAASRPWGRRDGSRGGGALPRGPDRLPVLAHEPDGRPAHVLLHGDAARRARDDPAARPAAAAGWRSPR